MARTRKTTLGMTSRELDAKYPFWRKQATYKDIKKKYDIVVSNAVINVIPDDWRSDLIKKMGALVKKGGLLIINTRTSNEIRNTKGITLDDDAEKLIPKGKDSYAYQRGHDINEWIEYIEACLNNRFTSKAKLNFEVKKATVANSGVGTGKAILCIKQ